MASATEYFEQIVRNSFVCCRKRTLDE